MRLAEREVSMFDQFLNDLPPTAELGEANKDGLRLLPGLTARVVAETGKLPSPNSDHRWHWAPDGGATFKAPDGGWIYVSNSEMDGEGGVFGGAGALRFSANGDVVDCRPILTCSVQNCAGGATPWGTWLSCEEHSRGRVWECDPFGERRPVCRPWLGIFHHEAVACDPASGFLYLTEDRKDGCLYRFVPSHRADLASGELQVARVADDVVEWVKVPRPLADGEPAVPTRQQLSDSTAFNRGEGIVYHDGTVYFATTGDNRVWAYDAATHRIGVIYDDDYFRPAPLTGVDNLTVTSAGTIIAAEDVKNDGSNNNMQLIALKAPTHEPVIVLRLDGHDRSEITGPAFDPDERRLYFSSQRGPTGSAADGVTFEVSGF